MRDRHPDPKLNGLNWQAIHDATKPAVENAQTMEEARRILRDMIGKLEVSHFAVVPSEAYTSDAYRGTAATVESAPVAQPGAISGAISDKTVRFGNLPETHVVFRIPCVTRLRRLHPFQRISRPRLDDAEIRSRPQELSRKRPE